MESFREIASTNSYLLQAEKPSPGELRVAIAGAQTQGRGRQGKQWYSPAGAGLWMSVAYTFEARPRRLPALTLAIGSAVAEELLQLGVGDIALKWPNDLVVGGRKLGGILLESCAGGMTAIAGIGINISLPKEANSHIKTGNMPVGLGELVSVVPQVECLAAKLIERLGTTLRKFDRDGFGSFIAAWSRFDALEGGEVVVEIPGNEKIGVARGIARGVASDGALIIHGDKGIQKIVSGSVRLIDCKEAVA